MILSIDIAWLQANFPELSSITQLNAGGFKFVFSAEHPNDGDVVLKLIRPGAQDAEDVRREILAATQVQPARVPLIYEHGEVPTPVGNCYWIRERRIFGQTVRERLAAGALANEDVLRLGLHTLETLVRAETIPIVHRDVKPDNVMCDQVGDFWLLDFGIARHLGLESRTATASAYGKFTPGYGPPEQFRNMKPSIDSRADLFALGVTLYECATGSNPFRAGAANPIEILRRVETEALPPLTIPVVAATEFRDLIAAMTGKRPDQCSTRMLGCRRSARKKVSSSVELHLHSGMLIRRTHNLYRFCWGDHLMEFHLQFGFGMMQHCERLVSAWGGRYGNSQPQRPER